MTERINDWGHPYSTPPQQYFKIYHHYLFGVTCPTIIICLPLGYNMVLCSECENRKLEKLSHSCFLRCKHLGRQQKTPYRTSNLQPTAESWNAHGVSSKSAKSLKWFWILWHVYKRPWRFCWVLAPQHWIRKKNSYSTTDAPVTSWSSLVALLSASWFVTTSWYEKHTDVAFVRLFQHQNICF